jgi:hypothetical protein
MAIPLSLELTVSGRLLPLTSVKIIPDERPLLGGEQSWNLQNSQHPQRLHPAMSNK